VFALLVNTVTTRARLMRLVDMITLATTYIALRAIVDYARGVNLVEGSRLTGPVNGLFGNPNDMALTMVAFLPLAVVAGLTRGRSRSIGLVGVPAMTAAIIFTQSRGGIVGLLSMMVVLLFQISPLRPGVAALVVTASLATIPMLPASFVGRMSSIFNAEEDPTGSREARKTLMREGYQAFLANPIVGIGAGQFQNYLPDRREEAWMETHNAVLQVASELGIAGVVVFMILVGKGFAAVPRARAALHAPRRTRGSGSLRARREPLELYPAGLAASLIGWFVAAMFASVAYYWTFYLVLGLAAALRDIALGTIDATVKAGRESRGAEAA
jgi:putative inorganic carbon (hco3(-)) transporter